MVGTLAEELVDWVKRLLKTSFKVRLGVALLVYALVRRFSGFKKSLAGKRILVTGAAAGIGRQIALDLAQEGAHLILWDINKDGLKSVAKEIMEIDSKIQVSFDKVDLQRKEAIYKAASKLNNNVWGIINNAGVVSGRYFLDTPDERIFRTINVNLLAHIWIVKAFLPAMLDRNDGHIVSMTSMAGMVGAPRMVDYAASKFASVGFTEALRLELGRLGVTGVKTTIVCPSHVNTNLFPKYKPAVFAPSLSTEYVSQQTVLAMRKNEAHIMMPRVSYPVIIAKAMLPVWFNDWIYRATGVFSAMDDHHSNVNLQQLISFTPDVSDIESDDESD